MQRKDPQDLHQLRLNHISSHSPLLLCFADQNIGSIGILHHFFQRNIFLSSNDFKNSWSAESTLASTHTRSDSSLHTIQGKCSHRSLDGFHNFTFGDVFTAADDSSKSWILFDLCCFFLRRKAHEMGLSSCWIKVVFFR